MDVVAEMKKLLNGVLIGFGSARAKRTNMRKG